MKESLSSLSQRRPFIVFSFEKRTEWHWRVCRRSIFAFQTFYWSNFQWKNKINKKKTKRKISIFFRFFNFAKRTIILSSGREFASLFVVQQENCRWSNFSINKLVQVTFCWTKSTFFSNEIGSFDRKKRILSFRLEISCGFRWSVNAKNQRNWTRLWYRYKSSWRAVKRKSRRDFSISSLIIEQKQIKTGCVWADST